MANNLSEASQGDSCETETPRSIEAHVALVRKAAKALRVRLAEARLANKSQSKRAEIACRSAVLATELIDQSCDILDLATHEMQSTA